MSQSVELAADAGNEDRLAVAVQKSKEAWRRLGMRLRSVTPAGLVRLVLTLGALAVVGWVLNLAVMPLVPFVVGLVLAYITAPLVEGLDRVMPRGLAVLLVMIGEFLFLLLIVTILIIPLARELIQIVQSLPSTDQLRRFFDDLVAYLRTLPEPSQQFIRDGLRQAAVQIRDNLATYFQTATDVGIGALFSLIKTFSFVIGLLVLPTWLYSVVSAQKKARQALDKALPDWARADFWAVMQIVDRTLSAALRGLVLQGIAVGVAIYLGLILLEQVGFVIVEYKLLVAVLAGLMELVPDVGPFLFAIPGGLIGFSTSTEMGLGLLGAYLVGRWLVHRLLVSRVEERVVRGIHPALMVVAIVAQRPDWHHDDDDAGMIKIVMTGSASDPLAWQPHIRTKAAREELARRFKDPHDPFKVVIVRDMWLTGFDAPCLHTMYVDKPMRSHGLMQAIARVNRVFKDKPGGLVVDYLGLANELREAMAVYTESGGLGETAIDQEVAVAATLEKYEVCRGLFHGFDWSAWTTGDPAARLSLLPAAQEHILAQEEGKSRLAAAVTALSKAFALAVPHEQVLAIRDDVAFFQAVKAVLAKGAGEDGRRPDELDYAIRQIVSRAVASDEVIDIFAAAGLQKPDISILSDEFLAEVRGLPQRNLAVETLRKLLEGEIKTRGQKNVVQARSFAEMLENAIRRYRNRAIEAAAVIEELIGLAREMREADQRGEDLGLTEEEIAFYDALEVNDSAVQVLGDETLRTIAQELVRTVRNNVTIDWTLRENVRAKMRVMVKRILRRYGYPPDKQEKATRTVLEQAEVLCRDWAVA